MMEYLKVISSWIMVFLILQLNAWSLLANGQEFKKVVELEVLPDVICLQETWLRTHLEFDIPGLNSIRCDWIDKQGGGCVTFIQDTIALCSKWIWMRSNRNM